MQKEEQQSGKKEGRAAVDESGGVALVEGTVKV